MPASARPDIIWIVTTQWRAQACGYAGDANARTPAIDSLAASPGTINYAQAVTPHPFGPFARAAFLTGVPSPENGVRDYWDALPRDSRTIAHAMNERGYATAFFGKWGVGERDRSAPLVGEAAARIPVPSDARGGFACWCGFEGGFLLNDPWMHGDGIDGFERRAGYQSDIVCDIAADWLTAAMQCKNPTATSPRFTVVSLEAPHPPYAAPTPAGIARPAPESLTLAANVPRDGGVETRVRREIAGYYAHIAATDASIGRLIARADAAADVAARPRPIIVFTSAHGDMHGSHGLFRKGWPHEESIRVPLLVRGAPVADAATMLRNDDTVSLIDLPAMTLAWSEGRAWRCPRDRAEISMPTVVVLPDQCDRIWSGWRSVKEKHIFSEAGTEWILPESGKTSI